ncbi:MAG: permease [Methanomassiliicoccales archaeon]
MNNWLWNFLHSGIDAVIEYLAQHTLTCLIPAFFIAGAIVALVRKDAVLRYFGFEVAKWKSYGVASVSGTILAVCSCTILPIFSAIYKKGSGIGPATTFLFSGPAINILAVIYTAQVLGYDLGLTRAIAAVLSSIIIGLIMALIFRREEERRCQEAERCKLDVLSAAPPETKRPRWAGGVFFLFLVLILVIGASKLDELVRAVSVYFLTVGVAIILIYYYSREEVSEWGRETWDLAKKIFPVLILGTFIVGVFAYFVPPETFKPFLGENSLSSCLLASILGAVLYMPTLLEVPIIGGVFGYNAGAMAGGPALSLLLAGPTISLPSVIVLWRMFGAKHTVAYMLLVIAISTALGMILGPLVTR